MPSVSHFPRILITMLTDLPTDISLAILRDLLGSSAKILLALDSAHCCTGSRRDFLALLRCNQQSSWEQVLTASSIMHSKGKLTDFVCWTLAREVMLSSLHLCVQEVPLLVQRLQRPLPSIRRLSYFCPMATASESFLDDFIRFLPLLPHLEEIDTSSACYLPDGFLAALMASNSPVRVLKFGRSVQSPSLVAVLAAHFADTLQDLQLLPECAVDGTLFTLLARWCKHLRHIRVPCGKHFAQAVCRFIAHYPHLESIRLRDNRHLGDEALAAIASCCPNLRSMDVEISSDGLTSRGIVPFLKGCPLLERLSFECTCTITISCNDSCRRSCSILLYFWEHSEDLRVIVTALPCPIRECQLKRRVSAEDVLVLADVLGKELLALTISAIAADCPVAHFQEIFAHCTSLESLFLGHVPCFTDEGLVDLAQLTSLRKLLVAGALFTDGPMIKALRRLPLLTSLYVDRCSLLSDTFLRELAACNGPNITELSFAQSGITDSGFYQVLEDNPHFAPTIFSLSYECKEWAEKRLVQRNIATKAQLCMGPAPDVSSSCLPYL